MEEGVLAFWGLENKNWTVGAGWDHQVGPIEEHLTHLYQELAEGTDSPHHRPVLCCEAQPLVHPCEHVRGDSRKGNKYTFALLCDLGKFLPLSGPKALSLQWNIGLGWRMHSLSKPAEGASAGPGTKGRLSMLHVEALMVLSRGLCLGSP